MSVEMSVLLEAAHLASCLKDFSLGDDAGEPRTDPGQPKSEDYASPNNIQHLRPVMRYLRDQGVVLNRDSVLESKALVSINTKPRNIDE